MSPPSRAAAPPVTLTIAGSDSGGGAGIQADLKTFHAFGTFGTTAVTAITAQDTTGVHAVHAVPTDVVRRQIDAVVDDLLPAACKTGMLATARLVGVVAERIADRGLDAYVLDPVMVATSGDRLLDRDAESAILERLLPLAAVVTPNLDEARILAGRDVRDEADMRAVAEILVERGARAALVKGGHLGDQLRGGVVVDVLVDAEGSFSWERPRIDTRSTHGTGCTLSAAITAGLAWGRPLREAVADALDYVHRAIADAPGLGHGNGPLNHFVPARRP